MVRIALTRVGPALKSDLNHNGLSYGYRLQHRLRLLDYCTNLQLINSGIRVRARLDMPAYRPFSSNA